MKSEITFWQNVILSKKHYEPQNREEEANYKIAEYFLLLQEKEQAA